MRLEEAPILSLSFVATVCRSSRKMSGVLARKTGAEIINEVRRLPAAEIEVQRKPARIVLLGVRRIRVSAAHREAADDPGRAILVEMLCRRIRARFGRGRETPLYADAVCMTPASPVVGPEHALKRIERGPFIGLGARGLRRHERGRRDGRVREVDRS